MEIRESSAYVKARTVVSAEYFAERGWKVAEGKNNAILIYIPSDQSCEYSYEDFAGIIGESDYHIIETGLKMSFVVYMFFLNGRLYKKVEVLPLHEYDIYTD
ncbi:hypothetical protein QWY86_05155 [Pedobacter aquatilis]|uniref:hypothetical protein n=1 Tax=Pedobacter aquatilis TaxID=351343 RepID=UPI0025B48146|nr:hypothetical protein [Pedobacter aquatilis]MDN3586043.1 hypothetical protein [Pedobacter aquatilis]